MVGAGRPDGIVIGDVEGRARRENTDASQSNHEKQMRNHGRSDELFKTPQASVKMLRGPRALLAFYMGT